MKKIVLLLLLLISSANTYAQTVAETDLTGTWKVKKATALKDTDKPETKELVSGFQKAIYTLNASIS